MERCGFCSSSLLQVIRNGYGREGGGRNAALFFWHKRTTPLVEGLSTGVMLRYISTLRVEFIYTGKIFKTNKLGETGC
jgi:hypothetical protein